MELFPSQALSTTVAKYDTLAPFLTTTRQGMCDFERFRQEFEHTLVLVDKRDPQNERSSRSEKSLPFVQWHHLKGEIGSCEASECDGDSIIETDQETTSYWQHCGHGWVNQVIEPKTKGASAAEPNHTASPFHDLGTSDTIDATGNVDKTNGKRRLPPRGSGKDIEGSDSSQEEQMPKRPKAASGPPERFACPFFKRYPGTYRNSHEELSGLPTPYYEYPEEAVKAPTGKACDQESEWALEYEDFLCGELSAALRDEFQRSVQAQLNISDPELQRRALDMTLKFHLRLFGEFQAQRQSENTLENDETIEERFPDVFFDLDFDADESWNLDPTFDVSNFDAGSHLGQSEAPATVHPEGNIQRCDALQYQPSSTQMDNQNQAATFFSNNGFNSSASFGPQLEPFYTSAQQTTPGELVHLNEAASTGKEVNVLLNPVSQIELQDTSLPDKDTVELDSGAAFTIENLPSGADEAAAHSSGYSATDESHLPPNQSNTGINEALTIADGFASTISANPWSFSGLLDTAKPNLEVMERELSSLKRERDELKEELKSLQLGSRLTIPGEQSTKQIPENVPGQYCTKTWELERRIQELEADQQQRRASAQLESRSPISLASSSPINIAAGGYGPAYIVPTPPRWLSPVRSPGASYMPQQIRPGRASGYNSSASGYDSGGGYPASPSSGPIPNTYNYRRANTGERAPVDLVTNPQTGSFCCTFPNCTAPPFQTQYLLNSHANVHSSSRPYFCPVPGCPRSEGGKGFKRKNEMIRHGLVHDSPGYVCPFCADREHKYPRADNLQRHVRVHHPDKDAEDPELREVLSQRVYGPSRGRRPGFVV
ncbi:hypothetical protein JX265_004515 [Neoarthrinium moseri]|uniref:C2H2-type domain-containing protein n=1 Tax=Neoarthrinium moseri TaxID=1658444 RepID=A0A9Q0ASZ7_9PEZI|nr:hypothetical protein JX265_004515 [Neoarthrinium moseri]